MRAGGKALERGQRLRLWAALGLYALAGLAVVGLLQLSPPKGPILTWLCWRLDVLYILYLLLGGALLFSHFWKKPWQYLDEVVTATQTLYERNDRTIALSPPLREVEGQLNQIKLSVLLSQQAAKEAEEKKNELVMYLAHDIRTPLTTVLGYLSLLSEEPDLPPKQTAHYIDIALRKAERLEALLNELFEITRFHTHSVQLSIQPVDLYALLSQVTEEFYPALTEKGNSLTFTAPDTLEVPGDPQRLARVFTNLLKNAVAYSEPGTELQITAQKTERQAVIVFRNHGKTIPPEQLASIFEKFTRLDEARLSDTGGSGLGLSIAREIVRLHGGDITAQSGEDMVVFTVTLPLRKESAKP